MDAKYLNEPLIPKFSDSNNNFSTNSAVNASASLKRVIAEMKQCDVPNAQYGFHSKNIYALVLSQNEEHIYTGSIGTTLKSWSTLTKSEEFCVDLHSCPKCLQVTQDGKYVIIGGFDSQIKFFNTVFQKFDFVLTGHQDTVNCLALMKDENFLVSGSEDTKVVVWDISLKKVEIVLEFHKGPVLCLCISRNGRYLITGGEDKLIVIWNAIKYRMEASVKTSSKDLAMATYEKNLVYGLEDGKIIVWNIPERKEKFRLLGHTLYINHLWVSENNELIASSSGDNTIKLWDLKDQKSYFTIKNLDMIKRLAMSKDLKKIYTGSGQGEVQEWKLEDQQNNFMSPHSEVSYSIVISKKNTYLICSSEKININVWDYKKKSLSFQLIGHKDLVYCLECSVDEKILASGGSDLLIKVWSLEKKSLLFNLSGHEKQVLCLEFSSDNKRLISGSRDRSIRLWDLSSQNKVFSIPAHADLVHSICFANQEKSIISASFDSIIKVWETSSQVLKYMLEGHTQYIMKILLTHDENYLISVSGDKTIKVWSLEERKEEFTLKGHTEAIWGLSILHEKNEIATSSIDSTIKVWSLVERKEKYTLRGHFGCATCCAYSADGNAIASTSFDTSIRLWDVSLTSDSLNPFQFQSKSDFMSMLSYFRDNEAAIKGHENLLISKYRFGLMHIYSHLGKPELLKPLLDLDPGFVVDSFGHSPLYYSIKKRSFACTDLLLSYLIRVKEQKPEKIPIYLTALEGEFQMILKTSSKLLPTFMDILLVTETNTFGIPIYKLPKFMMLNSRKINLKDFVRVFNDQADVQTRNKRFEKSIYLEFKRSVISFPMRTGSAASIRFLTVLLNCSKIQIFRSMLIRGLIKVKWKTLRWLILTITLLFWSNLVIMTYMVAFDDSQFEVLVAFVAVNGVLLLMKLIQMMRLGLISYFSNTWNIIELLRFGCCGTWTYLLYFHKEKIEILTWTMILLSFIRGLTGFRAFNYTRFYTRLILRAFQDIISFIFIFCYSIIAFGVLSTYNDKGNSITRIWTSSYDLSLGQYAIDENNLLSYASFMLASIINIIVMLSLLISILGDSFERFQMESIDIDYKEMAEELRTVEILIFCRRKYGGQMYLQICDTERNSEDLYDWEGRLRMIEKCNSSAGDIVKDNTDFILKKINFMQIHAEKSNNDLQIQLENNSSKIEKLEQKFDFQLQEIRSLLQKNLEAKKKLF